MVPRSITREHVNELNGDDNKAARGFLNHLKKLQEDHIPAAKLMQKLQKKHNKSYEQVQVQNKAEESENLRFYFEFGS